MLDRSLSDTVVSVAPMVAPIPDNAFWRKMRLGHALRTGHELAGVHVSDDGAIWQLVRSCCQAVQS